MRKITDGGRGIGIGVGDKGIERNLEKMCYVRERIGKKEFEKYRTNVGGIVRNFGFVVANVGKSNSSSHRDD